jgi:hypothetical protein
MGEYLPPRWAVSNSAAKSSIRENSCGSRGLTLPKTLGAGVSV